MIRNVRRRTNREHDIARRKLVSRCNRAAMFWLERGLPDEAVAAWLHTMNKHDDTRYHVRVEEMMLRKMLRELDTVEQVTEFLETVK